MDYMDEESIKAPKALRIIGKTIKWIFIVIVILMLLWMAVCSILQKGTRKMKKYIWTEEASEQYIENKKDFKIWKLTAFNKATLDKIFYIENLRYTENPSQFQFMLRYNKYNSNAKKILEGVSEEEPFTFVLKDDKGKTYTEYGYIKDSALVYRYYRIVFSGVDISEAKELTLYIYRNNGEKAEDSCTVWYNDGYKSEYKLSSSEKKAAYNVPELIPGRTVTEIPESEKESEAAD